MHESLSDLQKIERDPYYIKEIDNPTEDEQMLAVGLRPDVIQFLKHPAHRVVMYGLEKDPTLINLISEPRFTEIIYAYIETTTDIPNKNNKWGVAEAVATFLGTKVEL